MGTHSPSRSTMYLILLSIFLAVTMADPEPTNCKNKDSCDIKEYVQQINCPATHKNQTMECTCTDGKDPCQDFTSITNADMTRDKCKELCSSLVDICVFYRWDKVGYTNEITCTLMNVDQCQKGPVCVPYSKGCASGAVDNKCTSDSDIRPEGEDCKINLSKKRVSEDQYGIDIPWVCFDRFNKDGKELDVYTSTDVSVSNGVKCETTNRCTDFGAQDDAPFVTYTCNNITWEKDVSVPDEKNPVENEILAKELQCTINPLSVPKTNLEPGSGAELICGTKLDEDEDHTHYLVNPPNSCALLCDKHHVVTIQSGWADQQNGKAGWKLYVVGDPDPQPITDGEDLSCWSQRIFGHRRRG